MAISSVGRDAATAPFMDGTAAGAFLLRRSVTTGEYLEPQRVIDSAGGIDLEWVAAAGTGRVVSWSVIYGKPRDGVQTPSSVIAIVELDEGPWWWCELLDADPAALRVDLPVEVTFVRPDESSEAVPVFRIVDSGSAR